MQKIEGKLDSFASWLKLNTIYGEFAICQPVIIDLINSDAIQRLKKIGQSGITPLILKKPDFSRYEHSIGVMFLLQKYNLSLTEQISGLLHDVSHTVFSHLADIVFNHNLKDSYQDAIHEWYLNQTEIPQILKNYDIEIKDILHKNNKFYALETDLPDLCADRIDYNLQHAIIEKLINSFDIKEILKNLKYEDKNWFFENPQIAKKFAEISLYLTENEWTCVNNKLIYHFGAQALLRAIDIKEITREQIHFATDEIIWKILINSKDHEIQNLICKMMNYKDTYIKGDKENHNMHLKGKFRGIDPLVKIDNCLIRLTEFDKNFANKFKSIMEKTEEGHYLILK